ncbi:hypothetical protein [Legionella sp. CNM-4043-24]|uniref:hypothetical protein n=1 Tax=Legionella sp. CNM-4043-24 TaxID=3421646 RepID=UPI00403AC1C8
MSKLNGNSTNLIYEVIVAASPSRLFSKRNRFFSHEPEADVEHGRDHLSSLPYELIQKIIDLIEDPLDHINLALASRFFYHYVMDSLCSIPMELSEKNLYCVAKIRDLMTQGDVFTELDLRKIRGIIDHFDAEGRQSFLSDPVRFVSDFHSENRRRTSTALNTVFFKSIAEVQKQRTPNEQLAEKENYFRFAILSLSLPGILVLILSPYFEMFSTGAFIMFGLSVFCPMILLLLDMHTRLAYAFFTDVLLYMEITSVNDLPSDSQDFFNALFPDYEESDQPLYHMISNHIRANLYRLLFDYKKQQEPEHLLVTPFAAEFRISIEDNVSSILHADSDGDEPVHYNLFDEHSDTEASSLINNTY